GTRRPPPTKKRCSCTSSSWLVSKSGSRCSRESSWTSVRAGSPIARQRNIASVTRIRRAKRPQLLVEGRRDRFHLADGGVVALDHQRLKLFGRVLAFGGDLPIDAGEILLHRREIRGDPVAGFDHLLGRLLRPCGLDVHCGHLVRESAPESAP